MAIDTIQAAPTGANKELAGAYHQGATALEMLELDAERLSETAYALATAEAFDSNAQSAFYALGQLGQRLQAQAKKEGDLLTEFGRRFRGPQA